MGTSAIQKADLNLRPLRQNCVKRTMWTSFADARVKEFENTVTLSAATHPRSSFPWVNDPCHRQARVGFESEICRLKLPPGARLPEFGNLFPAIAPSAYLLEISNLSFEITAG
jgi:hypothetical protein